MLRTTRFPTHRVISRPRLACKARSMMQVRAEATQQGIPVSEERAAALYSELQVRAVRRPI